MIDRFYRAYAAWAAARPGKEAETAYRDLSRQAKRLGLVKRDPASVVLFARSKYGNLDAPQKDQQP